MKVLSLGLDRNILDKNSAVFKRAFLYEEKLDKYLVLVPNEGNKVLSLFKLFFSLNKILRHEKFHLVTIQDIYFLPLLVWFLRNKYHFKIEIQVHGFEKLNFFRKLLFKYNIKKADLIRVVSLRLKKELVSNFNIAEDKIYITPVAVDKSLFLTNSSSVNLHDKYPGKFIFLFVGRLVAVKNVPLILRALSRLDKSLAYQLVVVGDGPEKNELINLAHQLGISESVDFLGQMNNLSSLYQSADCLLLTSNSEGWPLVVIEAIMAGLPIIMTDVGSAGELVEDNVNGFVIPVNNREKLREKMELLVQDKNLLVKFRNNTKNFRDKILDKEELINQVITNWQRVV